MSETALKQLGQLQLSLYEKAYREAHIIVAGSSRTILAYSEKFERSLPRRFRQTTLARLISRVHASRFILYGDFHTLRQSQRGLLRLVRAYCDKYRTKKVVLALEMFKAADQKFINAYMAGRMTQQALLDAVKYDQTWGFPWKNFKMILDFAAAAGMPVIGINTANAGRDSLRERDAFAADQLVQAAERYPGHRIFCLIGEYHLADEHLPKTLKAAARSLSDQDGAVMRVLNNVDAYYFQISQRPQAASSEYLELRPGFYCVMNSPPWMKWHSFSMWEEMRHVVQASQTAEDGDVDPDFDFTSDDTFDVDFQFLSFVKDIGTFLKLKPDESDLESFHVHFSADGDFFDQLVEDGDSSIDDIERMIERASLDGAYVKCSNRRVLLTYASINNLAEAAGQFLHALTVGFNDRTGDPVDEFLRRILKSAVGLIASKVMNPRRKCLELHHYRLLLRRARRDVHRQGAHLHLETAAALVKFDSWIRRRAVNTETIPLLTSIPASFLEHDRESAWELSREIGRLLGYSLYKKVLAGKLPATSLRRLYRQRINSPQAAWNEIVALYRLR